MTEIKIIDINTPVSGHRDNCRNGVESRLCSTREITPGIWSRLPLQGTFMAVWVGQLVSTIGSGLTSFAVGVYIYQQTGSATLFAVNLLVYALPNVILSPLAGATVDRCDRRVIMILSDTGAGLSTLAIVFLYLGGNLDIWHIYLATTLNASFSIFQWLAYSASISQLVSKEKLGHAGGMVQIGEAVAQLICPAAAGTILMTTGLPGVILIDFLTYLFAAGILFFVKFPRQQRIREIDADKLRFLKEILYSWQYLTARQGLIGLLIFFMMINFISGMINVLLIPLMLDIASEEVVGIFGSIVGAGMLSGTLVMSYWGGPKKRVFGMMSLMAMEGIFVMLLGFRESIALISVAVFCCLFIDPIINGTSQALWQSKVAQGIQGRVFSMRRMIAWSTTPLAYILAGYLADNIFTPLLNVNGLLANSAGRIIGVGPGRGTRLLFIILGALMVLVSSLSYTHPRLRRLEEELPDAFD